MNESCLEGSIKVGKIIVGQSRRVLSLIITFSKGLWLYIKWGVCIPKMLSFLWCSATIHRNIIFLVCFPPLASVSLEVGTKFCSSLHIST